MPSLFGSSLSVAFLLLGAQMAGSPASAQAGAAPTAPVAPDAPNKVPTALLGVWKADIAASSFVDEPPRDLMRAFQYTADGKMMVIFMAIDAKGEQIMGHWAVQLDGSPGLEYHSQNGVMPYAEIRVTKAGPLSFHVNSTKKGVRGPTRVLRLSEDGQTLFHGEALPGEVSKSTVVYKRWNAAQ